MEFPAKGAPLLLFCCLFALPALGQDDGGRSDPQRIAHPDVRQNWHGLRPLTREEGLAIVRTALESRHPRTRYDCSHFVNTQYRRAGFPYTYASSSDLYAGVPEFRRVTSPQAGDLAVWPGHAGIVVNPAQHSFLSVLHTGPGVDKYDSKYWRRRGRPRFFRYVEAGGLSGTLRNASLRPTASDTEPEEPDGADVPDATGTTARFVERQALNAAKFGHPIVQAARPKPEQVSAAFLQACAELEQSLRGRDLFKSDQSTIVFDRFEVKKVHLRENQNWAEVQIDELVSFTSREADVRKRSERQRWPLTRRGDASWELTPSQNTLYLPQPAAARILAHELAQLTDEGGQADSGGREKAELARALNVLLGK